MTGCNKISLRPYSFFSSLWGLCMTAVTARWRVSLQVHQPSPSGDIVPPCYALLWVPWTCGCSDPQVVSNTTFSSHGSRERWKEQPVKTETKIAECLSLLHVTSSPALLRGGVKHNFYLLFFVLDFSFILTNVPVEALLAFVTSLAKSSSCWASPLLIPTLHVWAVFLYSSQDTCPWFHCMHFLLVLHFDQKVLTWSLLSCSYSLT